MEKNMNSWECDKLFASEASGPQKNLKMGLGGNLKFCGYGVFAKFWMKVRACRTFTTS